MIRRILTSISHAVQNIRANFLHTFLSVLGIVIGVAALVGILSLIDGMEKFAHEQISKTTTLEAVIIESKPYIDVDGVRMRKDSLEIIDYELLNSLKESVDVEGVRGYLASSYTGRFKYLESDSLQAGVLSYVNEEDREDNTLISGRWLNQSDLREAKKVAVISTLLAHGLASDSSEAVIGNHVQFKENIYEVVGIVRNKSNVGKSFVPFTLLSDKELKANTPACILLAASVEDVPAIKKETTAWLEKEYGENQEEFSVITNESRVEQANQGFLIFRIVMGLIVGISVLVGGIGVMNVLTISVTERTQEIGVRKAVGAKRGDILLQFLSESVTISTFGSALGLLFGVLGTMAVVPIIKSISKAPFEAAFTLNTMLVIAVVAVLVGIIFGTYPAMKASKLDPVDAIRHE